MSRHRIDRRYDSKWYTCGELMDKKTIGLSIYSIVCFVILYGGLACSYVFWKKYVDGQFGLVIPFTFLVFIVLNTLFKIPSVVDIILLSQSSKLKDFDSRKMSIICLVTIIASVIICIVAEFIMFLSTQGSSLG